MTLTASGRLDLGPSHRREFEAASVRAITEGGRPVGHRLATRCPTLKPVPLRF